MRDNILLVVEDAYAEYMKNPDYKSGLDLFKNKKHNLNFFRLFASRILILVVSSLLGNKTSDPMSGFFMFKKSVFKKSQKKLIKIPTLNLLIMVSFHLQILYLRIFINYGLVKYCLSR